MSKSTFVKPETAIKDVLMSPTPITSTLRVPGTSGRPLPYKAIDGAFQGSFARAVDHSLTVHDVPWYRRREYYTKGWTDPVIWRSAVVECLATSSMIYVSGQFGVTLMNSGTTQIVGYVGIFNAILLSSFIYATATATGGHLNPMITFMTILCGLTPLSRGMVLILAQTLAGLVAGGVLLGSLGHDRAVSHMGGGNFFDPRVLSPGQALLTETMSSATLLTLAIGNGLDPRQQQLYGPRIGPLLVGLSMGLVTCAGTGIAPGYTGPGLNPARAIALAVAGYNWQNHWIWWVGPALGSIIVAAVYSFAPPDHADHIRNKTKGSVV
ncbi:aquaporin-like protein [Apodospora peruviana]|uniref:Aquaporin-like protein n=1 Tax=Apodospora peruviana TaxID=516989 RepID=A0AAE0MBV9_9PEZI|nr:aquaporin-like protein [Apodospora peruviana]